MSERLSSLEAYASVTSRLEKFQTFSDEYFVAKGNERLNTIAANSKLPADSIERMVRIGLTGAQEAMRTEGVVYLAEKTRSRLKGEQADLREEIEQEITEKSITAEEYRSSIRQTLQNLQDIEAAFGADNATVLQLKHMVTNAQQELENIEKEMDTLYAALVSDQASEGLADQEEVVEQESEVDPNEAVTTPQDVEQISPDSSVQQRSETIGRRSLESQMIDYITSELMGKQAFDRTYAQVEELYQQFRDAGSDSRTQKEIRNSVMVMISNVKKMLPQHIEIKSIKEKIKTVGYTFSRSDEPSVVEKNPLGDVTEQNLVDFVSILFQYKTDLLPLIPNSEDAPSIDALVRSFNPPEMQTGNGSLLERRKIAVRSLLDLINNQPDLVYAEIGSASSAERVANAAILASEIEDALSSTITMSAEDWSEYESRLMKYIAHHVKGMTVISENCVVSGSRKPSEQVLAPELVASEQVTPELRTPDLEVDPTLPVEGSENTSPEEDVGEIVTSPDEPAPVSVEKTEKKLSKVDQFLHDLDGNVQAIVSELEEKGLTPSGDNPNPFFHVSQISNQIGWIQPFLDNDSNKAGLKKQIKNWIHFDRSRAPEISYYGLVYMLLEKNHQLTKWSTSARSKIVDALYQILSTRA